MVRCVKWKPPNFCEVQHAKQQISNKGRQNNFFGEKPCSIVEEMNIDESKDDQCQGAKVAIIHVERALGEAWSFHWEMFCVFR